MSMRTRLREMLVTGKMVIAPGAGDPFAASIIQRAGFGSVYLGGNAMALALGKSQPLLTLTETVDCANRVARAVDLPFIIDAGAGFGDVAHLHRTMIEIESSGAAALHIDDQPYPKAFGYHQGGGTGGLVPTEQMIARLRVALAARCDTDMMVIARTDSLRVTGSIEETIGRARAYTETGIDGLLILDLQPSQAQAVRAVIPDLPLFWIGGVVPPVPNTSILEAAGFAAALYPFNGVAAIADTLGALWADLQQHGVITQDQDMMTRMRGELQQIVGIKRYWDIEAAANIRNHHE